MITPEQLREWAQDADDGEDVALDGETLREIAEGLELLPHKFKEHAPSYLQGQTITAEAWADGWNSCLKAIYKRRSPD